MDTKISVNCGTKRVQNFEFDIDEICKAIPTTASKVEQERALELLVETMDDVTFADDGCRNDDAVNICIALHVLGYDAVAWLDGFWDRHGSPSKAFFDSDWDEFEYHYNRVSKYLGKWGPEGHEGDALGYRLD